MNPHRYFLLNKPINMVSQFVSSHEVRLLSDLNFDFPPGTHAIGRLDQNSEGLLLLTTNKKITRLLFQSSIPHLRTYLVQVKNLVTPSSLAKLAGGVEISGPNGTVFKTAICNVQLTQKPTFIQDALMPLHPKVVHSWMLISLNEGRFHQVRKMVAAVNHKCLRLIRVAIESIHIDHIKPGEVVEVDEKYFFSKLRLEKK